MKKIKKFLTKERHLNMPYLDFYLRIPFVEVRTDLFNERGERYVYEYIGIYIKIWKWSWTFRLYQPGENRKSTKATGKRKSILVRAKDKVLRKLAK